MMARSETKMMKAALRYFEMGFNPIPVRHNDKKPCIQWAKYQQIRVTEARIAEWFSKFTDANLGLVTGPISDLLVVDADTREGIDAVEECLPDAVAVPTVTTPRGGAALLFQVR